MSELSELIKKVKNTFQTYGYLTALKVQLTNEFISNQKGSILSEDENERIKASNRKAINKILDSYEAIFSYYDSVNLITVEDTEHKEFHGSGVNAVEIDNALFDDSDRNPTSNPDKCTHFFLSYDDVAKVSEYWECRKTDPDDSANT